MTHESGCHVVLSHCYRLEDLGDCEDKTEAAAERVPLVEIAVVAVVSRGMMGVLVPDRRGLEDLATLAFALTLVSLLLFPNPAVREGRENLPLAVKGRCVGDVPGNGVVDSSSGADFCLWDDLRDWKPDGALLRTGLRAGVRAGVFSRCCRS